MIHPINIPEDLLSANPRRPQFFRPRPKIKISYGPDGRRVGSDGSAVEPISPNTYWKDVFMRTFIRRMVPVETGTGTTATTTTGAMPLTHVVDIIDLSPTSKNGTKEDEEGDGMAAIQFGEEEEERAAQKGATNGKDNGTEEEERRKSSNVSTASSASSSASTIPDRPSPPQLAEQEFGPSSPSSSTNDEEEEGDVLTRMGQGGGSGKMAKIWHKGGSHRISRKAIRSMLKGCCPRRKAEGAGGGGEENKQGEMEEFARLDFSLLNLFGGPTMAQEGGAKGEELELVPEKRGCRVWTKRRQQRVRFEEEEEAGGERGEEGASQQRPPHIRFRIVSVRISKPTQAVSINIEAHNPLQKELQLEVETHLHKCDPRDDELIGDCVRVQNQVEQLKPGKG